MHRVIILALFLNVAMAFVHPVCKFVCTPAILKSCPVLNCGPNESPQHNPEMCNCCKECLPNKPTPGSEVCETIDCRGSPCPIVDCAPGYKPVRTWCGCCDKCEPEKTSPGSEVCETIDCNGNECPIVDCIAGYKPVRSECGCCDKCVPVKTNPGSEVCETIDCKGRPCPIVDCIEGYVPVRSDCGCCDKCEPVKTPSNTCGKHEVYTECGSACPKTCANLGKDTFCTLQCVEGCFCQEGLVRNDYGECVHPNQCPKPPSHTCGKNEVYNECGSACPQTCANLGKDQVCTLQCVKGCFCREGLIRNNEGACVHPNKCPKQIPGSEMCETIDCKGRPCPKIFCADNYKLVKTECGCCDKCEPLKKPSCGKHEVYTECGSACPKTCANLGKDQVCTKQCVKGCFCRKGLVRNEKGKCVRPKKCPKPQSNTCGKHEVYNECGSACPQTCANLGKDQICTKQCVKGCFCRKGLVRNKKGECICPKKCPKHSCKNADKDSSSE